MSEYVGNRIVPTHGGIWNSAKSYEPLVIVYEEGTGDSYISRKDVPAGTGLEQEDYWALCARFSEQMELYQEDVDAAVALTNSNKSTLNSRMDTLESRIAANVAASTDADADYAAEVVDARVSEAGKTYGSLGQHLRTTEQGYGLPPAFSANVSYHCTSSVPPILVSIEDSMPVFTLNEAMTGRMLLFFNRKWLFFTTGQMTIVDDAAAAGSTDYTYRYLFLDVTEDDDGLYCLHILSPGQFSGATAVYPNAVYLGFVHCEKVNSVVTVMTNFSKTAIPVGVKDSYGNYTLLDHVEYQLSNMYNNYLENHTFFDNGIWKASLIKSSKSEVVNRALLQFHLKYSSEVLDKGSFTQRMYVSINPDCVTEGDRLLIFYKNGYQFLNAADLSVQMLAWDSDAEEFVEAEYLTSTADYYYINYSGNVFQIVVGGNYGKYKMTHRGWYSCGYVHYDDSNCILPVEYISYRSYYPRVMELMPNRDNKNHMMGYLYSVNSNMSFDVDTFELKGVTHLITPLGMYTVANGVRYVGQDGFRDGATGYLYLVFYPATKILMWVHSSHFQVTQEQYLCVFMGMVYAGKALANFNGADVKLKGGCVPKVTVIGDSISTYSGYITSGYANYYSSSSGLTVQETWWMRLVNNLSMELFSNMSSSGSRVTTTLDTASQPSGVTRSKIVQNDDGESPDIVIIYLGTNDWNANVPVGTYDGKGTLPTNGATFREAYAMMIYNIMAGSPKAKIYCCTLLDRERGDSDTTSPEVSSGGIYLSEYNDAIREIADAFNAEVIDLHACGINHCNMSLYMRDYNSSSGSGLHPNSAGHNLMYRKIRERIEPFVDSFNRDKLPFSQYAEPAVNSGMVDMSIEDFVFEDE